MPYSLKNIFAFLWTKAAIDNQPLALTIADKILSQTSFFSNHAYKVLHSDGHFQKKNGLLSEQSSLIGAGAGCACVAAAYFDKHAYLTVSIFFLTSCFVNLLSIDLPNSSSSILFLAKRVLMVALQIVGSSL
jgi:hypothetical protein